MAHVEYVAFTHSHTQKSFFQILKAAKIYRDDWPKRPHDHFDQSNIAFGASLVMFRLKQIRLHRLWLLPLSSEVFGFLPNLLTSASRSAGETKISSMLATERPANNIISSREINIYYDTNHFRQQQ